jgi:hypothetical protein
MHFIKQSCQLYVISLHKSDCAMVNDSKRSTIIYTLKILTFLNTFCHMINCFLAMIIVHSQVART